MHDFKFLYQPNKIVNFIQNYAETTQRNFIIAVVSALNLAGDSPKHKKLYAEYYNVMMTKNKEIKEAGGKSKEDLPSWDNVLEQYNVLKAKVEGAKKFKSDDDYLSEFDDYLESETILFERFFDKVNIILDFLIEVENPTRTNNKFSSSFPDLRREREKIISPLQWASKYIFKGLHIVMLFAPIGAFGGLAYTIGKYGIATLLPLGKLMLTVYITMALFVFVCLGLILRYYKISILKFLNYIKEELLIVLGTSSSEAALPSLMEKLEKMGCAKPVVGLVVPAGYSFNLDGTTIYLSMAVIFLAQVFNIDLTLSQMLTIIGILMVTSKGAAGVTGSGFIVLASTLSAVQVIPIEGLALLLGVDRFMSEARAITNFIGNGVATVFLANQEKAFDRSKMEIAFSSEVYEYDVKYEI